MSTTKEPQIRQSSGLDFSKSVIIFQDDEIGMPAHIDSKEHTEILKRYDFIIDLL